VTIDSGPAATGPTDGGRTEGGTANGGQGNVRMTPAAIEALHALSRQQAEAVARAIATIGRAKGRPVVTGDNGRQYLAMVPDDDQAPVVMYRETDNGKYLVTTLIDRGTYKTYEIAERPGFLNSTAFRATVSAAAATALGIILGSRLRRSSLSHLGLAPSDTDHRRVLAVLKCRRRKTRANSRPGAGRPGTIQRRLTCTTGQTVQPG
jgi:hypothetical protein